ncbi:MAG: hypothetical protein N2441_10870 [Rhodocyclaceae bacterium]|nr:hypothetical protein [Rhodocyclaceae bacterium]
MAEKSLLVIITESVIEDTIVEEIVALGAKGFTACDARGLGTHGMRTGRWTVGSNVRIEVIGDSSLLERIVAVLQEKYDADYGLLMYTMPVNLRN